MTGYVDLSWWTPESVSCICALPALLVWILIVRGRKVRSCSRKSASSWSWWWVDYRFAFSWNLFTIYSLLNVDRIMAEYIFFPGFLFLFIGPFLLRMSLEVIFDDTVKNRVSDSGCHVFSASNALGLFGLDELSQTGATKSMITRLNAHWNVHDFETKWASDLLFDWTRQTVLFGLGLLLLFLLLLLFSLLLLLFFLFLLFFDLFLLFFLDRVFHPIGLLSFKQKLNSESQCFGRTYFWCWQ